MELTIIIAYNLFLIFNTDRSSNPNTTPINIIMKRKNDPRLETKLDDVYPIMYD